MRIISLSAIKGNDKVADVYPMMTTLDFEALLESIKTYGQREPIILCRKLIIDGRNRVKALTELGISEVMAIELPVNTSKEKKEEIVKVNETRRHQTITQRACGAVKQWVENKPKNMTQKEFVKTQGVSQANFTIAKWIHTNSYITFEKLFNVGKLKLGGDRFKITDSLSAIKKQIQKDSEDEDDVIDTSNGLNKLESAVYVFLTDVFNNGIQGAYGLGATDDMIARTVKSMYKQAIEQGLIEHNQKQEKDK